MKFHVDSYHFKLLRDYERLSVFKDAIEEFADSHSNQDDLIDSNFALAYDLGCGSGVLSYFASEYFDKILSIEMSPSTFKLAKENLKDFENVDLYNENVIGFDFSKYQKADLIICEMLDTALIDEEEVPVLTYAKEFLKENGKIIPQGIINQAEPIHMDINYIQYEDDEYQPKYDILGRAVTFSEFDFLEDINESFSSIIEFVIDDSFNCDDKSNFVDGSVNGVCEGNFVDGSVNGVCEGNFVNGKEKYNSAYLNEKKDKIVVNGIKLTSFTKLNDNIICGPTPMLNSSMLVPFDEIGVEKGEKIRIRLSYIMGGGIETIKTEVLDD